MQRSDHSFATDDQVRELVRQLADSAPLAPTWERVSTTAPTAPGPPPAGRRKLVLAAVALVSVVLAVAWLRPDPADTPAGRPPDTVDPQLASTVPPVRSPFEVRDLPPIDAQWCSARHNLVAARRHIDDLSRRSDELAGLSDLRSQMSVYGIVTGPLAALSQHAEFDADLRAMVAVAVEAFAEADDQVYAGAGGAEGAGLAAALSAWERAADGLIADTSSSWVGCEPSSTVDAVDAAVVAARAAIQCASVVALDDALRRIADDVPDESDDLLVAAVARSVGGWFEGELGSPSVVAARAAVALTGPSDDRATELAVLRDEAALLVADPEGPCIDRMASEGSNELQRIVSDREAES